MLTTFGIILVHNIPFYFVLFVIPDKIEDSTLNRGNVGVRNCEHRGRVYQMRNTQTFHNEAFTKKGQATDSPNVQFCFHVVNFPVCYFLIVFFLVIRDKSFQGSYWISCPL